MARVFLKRTLTGFVPADETSLELTRKYKVGGVYRADVVRPRSYEHHKMIFSMLSLTYKNLPERLSAQYPSFDSFRYALAKASGHIVRYIDLDGVACEEAGSLSYDAIPDDVEFGQIAAAMMTICAQILDVTEPELAGEVSRYADEHYGRAA